jgi:hypothetical protein
MILKTRQVKGTIKGLALLKAAILADIWVESTLHMGKLTVLLLKT